jgi:hypothetical protein
VRTRNLAMLTCLVGCVGGADAGTTRSAVNPPAPGVEGGFSIADASYDARTIGCSLPDHPDVPDGLSLRIYGLAATRSAQLDMTFSRPPARDAQWQISPTPESAPVPVVRVTGLVTDRELYEDRSWTPSEGTIDVEILDEGLRIQWEGLSVDGEALGSGHVRCVTRA